MAGVTRAAVSRTLAHLEEGGYVEVDDSGDAAVKYRAPVRLTALGGESMSEADRIIREVLDTTGKAMGVEQRDRCTRRCARFSIPCARSKACQGICFPLTTA